MFASGEKEKNAIAQLIYFVSTVIWFYEADYGDGERVCQKGKGEFHEPWESSTRAACPASQSRVWYTSSKQWGKDKVWSTTRPDLPKKDYVSHAVWLFYLDIKDRKSNDNEFKVACKFATRSFEPLSELNDSSVCPPNQMRASGGGKKMHQKWEKSSFPVLLMCAKAWKVKFRSAFLDWRLNSSKKLLAEGEKSLTFGNWWILM